MTGFRPRLVIRIMGLPNHISIRMRIILKLWDHGAPPDGVCQFSEACLPIRAPENIANKPG
jgi:hypothetical protein